MARLKQLQGLKRGRSRQAGPTQDGPVGPGKRSRAGRAARAPPGLPCQPQPGSLGCGRVQAPQTSHGGCSSSGLPPAHEAAALPESIGPSPAATSPCEPASVQFSQGWPLLKSSCALPRLSFSTSGSGHHLYLCAGVLDGCRDLGDRATVGRPAEATVLLGTVLVHSQSSRMKIHVFGLNHG